MNKTLLSGVATVALAVGTAAIGGSFVLDAAPANAAQGEGQQQMRKGQGQGGGAGGQGPSGEGRGGAGSSMEEDIMRGGQGRDAMDAADDGDDDSDRPDWAGVPGREGKPGRGNETPSVSKGDFYGDLYAILRADDGTPVLDENGNVQPCISADCSEYIQLTEDGEVPAEYADQVTEVEFGRLNVSRAPSMVIEHALTEALANLDGLEVTANNLMDVTDPAGRLISLLDDATIDSPLENLAIYKALIEATADGVNDAGFYEVSLVATSEGGDDTVLTLSVAPEVLSTVAASALAAASDKTGTLTVDEVVYISGFLGVADELAAYATNVSYDPDVFDREVTVLVEEGGVYVPTVVNLLEAVNFNTMPQIDDDGDGIDTFAQNADDAVQVLEYVHDNAIDLPEVTTAN